MTRSQSDALLWLRSHAGDGVIDRRGCLLAAGELAPFQRVTWNRLAAQGYVEFYGPRSRSGHMRRVRLTEAGRAFA